MWTIAQTAIKILPFQLLMYYNALLLALRERAVGSAANTIATPTTTEITGKISVLPWSSVSTRSIATH